MERDKQLDSYRALIMVYIVCVIHTTYWFNIGDDIIISLALFEMPVIFFIAGAAQSFKKAHDFKTTIINRIKRILVPYYIFLFFLLASFFIYKIFNNHSAYLSLFDTNDVIKMLTTEGSDKIPYYSWYTWFISVYFIISCSLPVQVFIINKLPRIIYMLIVLCCFILWKITGIESPENIVENILCYNFFYISGFLYYKKIQNYKLIVISALPIVVSAYAFTSGIAIPMQDHKFPPDMLFLIYNLGVLCILSLIFSKIRIKYNYILKIWNERGYTIYLYQSISHFILYKITINRIGEIHNTLSLFIIYFCLAFIISTTLSYITYPAEKFIKNRVLRI